MRQTSAQVSATIVPPSAPSFGEVTDPADLLNTRAVANDLAAVDWSFHSDDTGFLTHDILPYPAKFIPQIPGHLIARLSVRGDLVFDPFGGSGTTALEAIRLGRRALVVDANPVGILAGRVKTTRLTPTVERDLNALRTAMIAYLGELPPTASLLSKYSAVIPAIPNREKWFPDTACAEMALIRAYLERLETVEARDVASLAMCRIVLRASTQDSETRYVAKQREIPRTQTLAHFIKALDAVVSDMRNTSALLHYGVAKFAVADTRNLPHDLIPDSSVDLVVTSPPYGNAMDYHLYHRFRLFWLGEDPRELARMEVGSHLRHQKESTGFADYASELQRCVENIARVLRPGRYAAFVIGDFIYDAAVHRGDKLLQKISAEVGLDAIATMRRPIHGTKRSFKACGRRATSEAIIVVRKRAIAQNARLDMPAYRLWDYETRLREQEIRALRRLPDEPDIGAKSVAASPHDLIAFRRLTFTRAVTLASGFEEKTWQAILENGLRESVKTRKDPKYVTHGLHPYKGKFYPQLAKALLNISGAAPGGCVLDPYCGSGTTLLESHLNGFSARGCDLNPLAAKIARAKIGILSVDPELVSDAVEALLDKTSSPFRPSGELEQFTSDTRDEISKWFAPVIAVKLNWLLRAIRSASAGVLQDFFEVALSSIIRDVSHQDPSDLRIRRRKVPLDDADAIGLFQRVVRSQYERLEKFWAIRGYAPSAFCDVHVESGDSRQWETLSACGVRAGSVDVMLTSPPYATALPYIDTDRLSLLVICGMDSSKRQPVEEQLTGSREITVSARKEIEAQIAVGDMELLPKDVERFITRLFNAVRRAEVGFRRRNMPALLLRYFIDVRAALQNASRAIKPGGKAFIVMGDNMTTIGAKSFEIPSTEFIRQIAEGVGLNCFAQIPISVTTEDRVHVRNAIRRNAVICCERTSLPPHSRSSHVAPVEGRTRATLARRGARIPC